MSDPLQVEVWRAATPLPKGVMTAVGLFDTYYHLVVVVHSGDVEGWGYSGLASSGELDLAVERALRLLAARPLTLDTLLGIEHFEQHFEQTGPGGGSGGGSGDSGGGSGGRSDTAGKAAASAIALGAWDTTGRRLGVACADLWGRRPGTETLDCYASGFFLDSSPEELDAEALRYRAAGFRLVKMRTGLPVDEDLRRFDTIRATFAEPGSIAVDAFHSWRPPQALDFASRAAVPLLWMEDATPYADLGRISSTDAPIAAGESLETTDALTALRGDARVDFVLLDVQRLGGPLRWLATASVLAAAGARIGAHVYTGPSAHLLACVDHPLPVEVFDWSDALFDPPPGPAADGRLLVSGPGFGLHLRRETLRRFGERLI